MSEGTFDRYQIKRKIGQGGMAAVYLAHDPRFGRDVALKVLSLAYRDDPTFRGRFERESRTVAKLEHRAIVPVYDFGEDHNQLFLVMRHMPGGTLADRIVMKPFLLDEAVPIIRRLAEALDHAHAHGVIHRDLKPANVLFDQYNNAFLSDFGIVKLAAEGTDTDLTGSGVIGTPAYMSPEQIHGDTQIDGRSDIYTLGIILFEMLTGRKPYRADTPVKQMMAHVLNPIPPIRQLNPTLPPDCETLIQKALAKEPDKRFDTAVSLFHALTMTAIGEQIPPPLFYQDEVGDVHEAETKVRPFPDAATMAGDNEAIVEPSIVEKTAVSITPNDTPDEDSPTLSGLRLPDVSIHAAQTSSRRWWVWGGLALIGIIAAIIFVPQLLRGESDLPETAVTVTVSESELAIISTPTATTVPIETTGSTETAVSASPAPTVFPTSSSGVQLFSIGQSANGSELEVIRFGNGAQRLIFVGGIHAGWSPASVAVAEELVTYLMENEAAVPPNLSIIVIPSLNPDSPQLPGELNGRLNGNSVDLNRNWGCRWRADPVWRQLPAIGLGGTAPFSEPEVIALRDFILNDNEGDVVAALFWQAQVTNGLVSPGSCQNGSQVSTTLATTFGQAAGYAVVDFETLVAQEVNGDATNWLDDQGIPSASILLPAYDQVDWENNLAGVLAIMELYGDVVE